MKHAFANALPLRLTGAMLLMAAVGVAMPAATAETTFTEQEKQAIETLVREVIRDNPELIMQSVREHQERAANEQQRQAELALVDSRAELEQDPATPVVGNLDGDVTVVEFFDYNCGYCKQVFPAVRDLVESDGNIRYVLKELPILGPSSVTATRASLAVWNHYPEKYFDFHGALILSRGALSDARILKIAEDMGLDRRVIEQGMADETVDQAIEDTRQLAARLNLRGTPAFVIGDRLIPGAVDADALRELISEARSG